MDANSAQNPLLVRLGSEPAQPSPRIGAAASLALHGLVLGAVIFFLMHRAAEPEPSVRPVFIDLVPEIPLGERSTAPAAPVRASVPQQKGARGPRAAPKPEGVRPHGDKPFDDPLALQLKNLAKLRSPDSELKLDADGTSGQTASADGATGEAAYGVRDAIRAAVLRRWNLNLASLGNRDIIIHLRLSLSGNGDIKAIAIEGEALHKKDLAWMDIALSARHAAELSAPFPLPASLRTKGLSFTLDLNPRDTQR